MGPIRLMLLLASGSPRRRELLELAGFTPSTVSPNVDESVRPDEEPLSYVQRIALSKVSSVDRPPGSWILAADTTVTCDGQILGKPLDRADGFRMLRLLSGRAHQTMTAVAICDPTGETTSFTVTTKVTFADLSDDNINWYLDTGEPFDKAGSYAIQGSGGSFITSIDGSYSNVVGLPMAEVVAALPAQLRRPSK